MRELQDCFYRISVKALIFDKNGKVLLCKENSGIWDLPGGGLNHGENATECLKRELFEEMGLEVEEINSRPEIFVTANKKSSKSRPWIANICYKVKVKSLDFKKSDECEEIGFFSKSEIENLDVIENVREVGKLIT